MKIICHNAEELNVDVTLLANSGTYQDLRADLPEPPQHLPVPFDKPLMEAYFTNTGDAEEMFAVADYLNDKSRMRLLYPTLKRILQARQQHTYTVISIKREPFNIQRLHTFEGVDDPTSIAQQLVDNFYQIFMISLYRIYAYQYSDMNQSLMTALNYNVKDKLFRKILHTPITQPPNGHFFSLHFEPEQTLHEFIIMAKKKFLTDPKMVYLNLTNVAPFSVNYGQFYYLLAIDGNLNFKDVENILPQKSMMDKIFKMFR